MIDVPQDVKARIASVLAGARNGDTVTLDARNAEHRTLITELLAASGKGPERYPALNAAVANPPAGAAGEVDASIVDLGRDSQGRATSRTWLASRGGAYISGATTLVMDADSGETLASGAATQVGGTLVQVSTRSAQAAPAAKSMQAVTFAHSQQSADAAPSFSLVATTQPTSDEGLAIDVTEPVQTRSTGSYIVIGEGRMPGFTNSDADYTYPSSANVYPDRLVVPFTGNATLPYETAVSQQSPIGITTKLYVTSAAAWTYPLSAFDLSGPVTASGYTVTWSYPFDNQPIDATASIQYGQLHNLTDPVVDFFYQFAVPVDNVFAPIFTFTVCSEDTPDEPSINCQKILDLQYWWHCLAEGTLVTLDDGSEAPIETLDNRSVVAGGAAVIATSRAPHHDNEGRDDAVRLRTEGGRQLLLTAGHAVVTPQGVVAARDLRAGMQVLTAGGPETVESAEPTPHEGLVYNLRVEPSEGRAFGAYLANGILVGDHLAQAAQYHARRHDPDRVLPTLPQTHHQDWRSALADATAR
jgi:hypothetical protein